MAGPRERRAEKQRRRDAKRGRTADAKKPEDPGLPPETLQALLRRAAADLAGGDEGALTELRRVLAEHLARRRERILAACDVVTAEVAVSGSDELAVALAGGETVSGWAERTGVRTEEAAVATVRLLASLT
ncbi:hypothetical protein EV188_103632 [Actinomycetospora succinea]|uniref:Uncharacterized protein n=1 Tax=Actinomycetospora succinea TaxID=663603 RepID=A0A4R6VP05_9PSEU|nr:hypothetical protein [Actinomycetospora succinea]TDQ61125.1 hypothetical protein EV188_103632 [Actinomycetospora succinea]